MKKISKKIKITKPAIKKITNLKNKNKTKNLRIFIKGGGCNGFQYQFHLDEKINNDDILIKKKNILLIIDVISMQYLIGSTIDFSENLEGSKFIIHNPQARNTCGCGASFNI